MTALAANATREEKEKWLLAPFELALLLVILPIPSLVYWYLGTDDPTVTVISLTGVILAQFGCILWGVLRLRNAIAARGR